MRSAIFFFCIFIGFLSLGECCNLLTDPDPDVEWTFYPDILNETLPVQHGTYCISECPSKNTDRPKLFKVEHTCENGAWSVPLDKTDCECTPFGDSRGGEWTCIPSTPSVSSYVESGTTCIFTCENTTEFSNLIKCDNGIWDIEPSSLSCDNRFECQLKNLTVDLEHGKVVCDDAFIIENTECRLDCDKGFSSNGVDRSTCQEGGNWTVPEFTCFEVKETLTPGVIIFGGESSGSSLESVEFFSPDQTTDCVKGYASMPEDRTFHSVSLLDDNYVICGGKTGKTVSNTCLQYSFTSDEWSNVPEQMPVDRWNFAAAVYKNTNTNKDEIWIIGGTSSTNDSLALIVDKFDGTTWTSGPERIPSDYSSMNNANIAGLEAVVVGNVIYVAGGRASSEYLAKFYKIDENGAFVSLSSMYIERQNFAMAEMVVDSKNGILVAGGCCGEALNTVEFYNFGLEDWTIYAGRLVEGRYGNAIANFGGRILTFGGISAQYAEEFDMVAKTWKSVTSDIVVPKMNHGFARTEKCWATV